MSTLEHTQNHTYTRRERLEEYGKLVRMLIRAYYTIEYVIIMDCLLDLITLAEMDNRDLGTPVRISELIVASKLQMNPRRVREVLAKLRVDQLICGQQKVDERKEREDAALALANSSNITGRINPNRPVYKPVATRGECVWSIDFDQLIRVVKYRHWAMLKRLNTKVDKSDVRYACPTPQCPQYRIERSLFDLLLDNKSSSNNGSDIFRCSHCQYRGNSGQMEFTPLRAVNENNGENGDKSLQSLKMKFTTAVIPLDRQIKLVDRLMEEDAELALNITKDEEHQLQQQEQQRMSMSEPTLLPPTVQSEDELKKKAEAEAAEATKAEEERLAYETTYAAELERLQRQQQHQPQALNNVSGTYDHANGAAMQLDQMTELLPESEEIVLNVNGRQVALSNITQQDINSMTEEEFAVYEMYAQRDDEFV